MRQTKGKTNRDRHRETERQGDGGGGLEKDTERQTVCKKEGERGRHREK